MWGVWLAVALGAVPDGVRPVLAPPDAPARFVAWAQGDGHPERTLPCVDVVVDRLLVCFRVLEGDRRRWVHSDDLAAWGVDRAALVREVAARAVTHLEASGRWVPVRDMSGRYWQAAEGDGWEAAPVLAPEAARARLGLEVLLVGAPSVGVTLAWSGGEPTLDRVMAVGVREMFERQPQPVCPVVLRWDGQRWAEFAEAVPRTP